METPLLLVHGLGGSLRSWIALIRYLTAAERARRRTFAGQLVYARPNGPSRRRFTLKALEPLAAAIEAGRRPYRAADYRLMHATTGISGMGDLFVLTFPDRFDFRPQPRGLREAIAYVRERTGAPKVDLVTHSLGGIVARCYLVGIDGIGRPLPYEHDVRRVIMLAPPNLGVAWPRWFLRLAFPFAGTTLASAPRIIAALNQRDLPTANGEQYEIIAGRRDSLVPAWRTPLWVNDWQMVLPHEVDQDHRLIHSAPEVLAMVEEMLDRA